MAWLTNQCPFFLPSLQNIMSVLSARTGRTSLTQNSILSKFRATVRSWVRRLAGSLLFNSPFIWIFVRTHFSIHFLILARCFGRRVGFLRLSLNYRATISLAVEGSVKNEECGKCVVWKVRGVESAECGKCGVWKMRRKFQFSISISMRRNSTDFTNTYYHPNPAHIRRENPVFTAMYESTSVPINHLTEARGKCWKNMDSLLISLIHNSATCINFNF